MFLFKGKLLQLRTERREFDFKTSGWKNIDLHYGRRRVGFSIQPHNGGRDSQRKGAACKRKQDRTALEDENGTDVTRNSTVQTVCFVTPHRAVFIASFCDLFFL